MMNEKKSLYAKAYVEVYELIKRLTKEEYAKIPTDFIEYIKSNMDRTYIFNIDESKKILEQNYSVEAKALIVEMYERFFASEEEKNYWQRYDMLCNQKIEEKKKEKYNVNVFESSNNRIIKEEKEQVPKQEIIEYKEKSVFVIIKEKIRSIIKGICK